MIQASGLPDLTTSLLHFVPAQDAVEAGGVSSGGGAEGVVGGKVKSGWGGWGLECGWMSVPKGGGRRHATGSEANGCQSPSGHGHGYG